MAVQTPAPHITQQPYPQYSYQNYNPLNQIYYPLPGSQQGLSSQQTGPNQSYHQESQEQKMQ